MDTPTPETDAHIRREPAALPATIKKRYPVTPDSYYTEDKALPDTAVVYLLKYPTEQTITEWVIETRRRQAFAIDDAELRDARLAALPLLSMNGDEEAARRQIKAHYSLLVRLQNGKLGEDEQAEFGKAQLYVNTYDNRARRRDPALNTMLCDAEEYDRTSRAVATALWLDGITTAGDEGYAQVRTLERDARGFVTDEELAGIPFPDKYEVGLRALTLRSLTAAQKKS